MSATVPVNRDVPIIFVHGAHHGKWFWSAWVKIFSALGWPCLAIDLPGRGDRALSADAFARIGQKEYAEAIAEAAAPYGDRCVVIGHSMGGLAAQIYATTHRPVAVVLVAPGPPGELGFDRALLPEHEPLAAPSVEEMKARWFHGEPLPEFGDHAAVHARLVHEAPRALNDRNANRIACPPIAARTLVVAAEFDGGHQGGEMDRAIANYHKADFVCFRGFGHDLCIERGTERAARFVDGWLALAVAETRTPA